MNGQLPLSSLNKSNFSQHYELLEKLKEYGVIRKISKGRYLYRAEQSLSELYFVVHGRVKTEEITKGDKLITTNIADKGDILGLAYFNSVIPKPESAIAMTDSQILAIKHSVFHDLMTSDDVLAIKITKYLSWQLHHCEKTLESSINKSSKARIADFLVNLAQNKGQRVGYEWLVRPFMTHQDIAGITGTSRQTVTTTLNEFRNKNILIFDRNRLLIRDLDMVKNLSK